MQVTNTPGEPERKRRGTPRAEREEGAAVTGSLSRGLQILDVLTQATGWLSLSDIVAETGLDASTVHRLLQALTESGYAARDEGQKRYLPGPRALSPLSLFHPLTQLRREAVPVLEYVQAEVGETCALVLFLGHERLVVDFVRGNHPLSPYYDSWLKSPLHGSASGKLLLAWMPEAERDELLGPGPYEAYTPKTVTAPNAFAAQLEAVRQQGYAVAREDAYPSLLAMGVPLCYHRDTQPVGCLVVTSPSNSLPEASEPEVAGKLQAAVKLLMNSAPSMQIFRQWTVRGPRRAPVGPAIA
jgi:DNA-binding IclR family transcriptional regulator